MNTIKIEIEFTAPQALAYAQLLKRICWTDFRSNAVSDDETHLMIDASETIRVELARAGYVPR